MKEQNKLSFDFARDTTKQVITLSTTIIVFTATFSKNFLATPDDFSRILIIVSWVSFLFSVIFGVWTLCALTGSIESQDEKEEVSIWRKNITIPSFIQLFCFLSGLCFTVWFSVRTIVKF